MIPFKTLEAFLEKCEGAYEDVRKARDDKLESIKQLEKDRGLMRDQLIAISAQMDTLKELMNIQDNPPLVEIPMAPEEDIEELFDKRLDMFEGIGPDEFYKKRQENTYKKEAMRMVEDLDAINRQAGGDEEREGNS